ncbi:single-stranded DNA-binding protein [Agromyces sp. GXQ0307]|uniref:single-stranded DNA-binding protein n=2 Tax=unclassified Agromyces TaxID=2639701 RepID=UPI00383ADEE0
MDELTSGGGGGGGEAASTRIQRNAIERDEQNRYARSRAMATRTITGNLAADPEVVQAGSIKITKFRVLENTGEYRRGEYLEHDTPTVHFVEAKFELGENAVATLHKGDAVIVVGREHTNSWGEGDQKQYGRVIEADNLGPSLARAVAQVRRTTPEDDGQ